VLRGRQYSRRRSCCHRLHIGGLNLHCYGLRHHVYGKNEIVKVLLPNQNPFDTFEWAPRNANPLTTFQEKMWFYAEVTFNYPSDRLNLFLRDDRNTFAVEQNRVDSRSCKDLQSASGSSLNKDIAREQGEGNSLLSVFPESYRLIEWKKHLKALFRQHPRHCLLVLVASIEHPPGRGFAYTDF
jgi:hypothetical protein